VANLFALNCVSSAVDTLRVANRLMGRDAFDWRLLSIDGRPVRASNGIEVSVNGTIADWRGADILAVCAGLELDPQPRARVHSELHQANRSGLSIGAICAGAVIVARAGLLNGKRCTIHWENLRSLREEYPDVEVTSDIFAIDRNCITCAGGMASLDMMLALIKTELGAELATTVSDWLVHSGMRSADEPLRSRYLGSNSSLNSCVAAAVELMESHVTDLLTLDQIAMLAGVSSRKLQRNFKSDLSISVMRCYMDIRLHKADELLRKTRMAVAQVAFSTGFVDQAHFASVYREKFGFSPTERRKKTRVSPPVVRTAVLTEESEDTVAHAHH